MKLSSPASAHEQAGKRRRSILLDVTEMFCKYVRPSTKQISQYKEQFYLLIASSSFQDKRIISASLSNNAFTPRTIAYYLAMELVQIAAPVLLISPVLKEIDLINIVRKTTPEHVAIIARRKDLTEKLCEQICLYGGEAAHQQLMQNPAIRQIDGLADKVKSLLKDLYTTAPKASEPLVAEQSAQTTAESAPSRQAVGREEPLEALPLVANDTAQTAAKLEEPSPQVANVATGEQSQNQDSQQAREALVALAARGGKLGKEPASKARPKTAPAARPERQVNGIFTAAVDGIGAKILQHARKRDVEQCAELVHQNCGLKTTTALQLITEPGGESLCLVMKALAIPKGTASQILLLLNKESGRSVPAFKRLIDRYGTLETAVCQDFLVRLGADFSASKLLGTASNERRKTEQDDFSSAITSRRSAISGFGKRASQAEKKSA